MFKLWGIDTRNYVYGNYIDETLVRANIANGTGGVADKYYYAHNHLYSCVALLDNTGTVVERYEYNAYGRPTIYNTVFSQTYTTSQYNNDILFTGREVDFLDAGSLTLQYNRNRYYDYDTGRWLTQDPLGIIPAGGKGNRFDIANQYHDGINLYKYAGSSPLDNSDSSGLEKCKKTCKWSGTISGWSVGIIAGMAYVKVSATGQDENNNFYVVFGKGKQALGAGSAGAGWFKLSIEFDNIEAPCQWPLSSGDGASLTFIGTSIINIVIGKAGYFTAWNFAGVGGINVFTGGGVIGVVLKNVTHVIGKIAM